jgi:hypothetical protein
MTPYWLRWDPVTLDCQGNPEVVVGYAILFLAVWIAGWYECAPGIQCPIYASSPWMELGVTEATEWSLSTMPNPPVGGIDIYRAVSTDHAGNTSEDCDAATP